MSFEIAVKSFETDNILKARQVQKFVKHKESSDLGYKHQKIEISKTSFK